MFEEPEYVTSQTDDIVISACPTLVEENRRAQEFLWGYYLRIENNSAKKIQLLGKNWNVTDSFGNRFLSGFLNFATAVKNGVGGIQRHH